MIMSDDKDSDLPGTVTTSDGGLRQQVLGLAGRTFMFTLVPALSIASPLVVLPAVATTHGAPGIAATAIGQSVGAVCGCVVGLAWPLRGPAEVARSDADEKASIYQRSINSRVLVLLLVAPLGVLTAALISSADPAVSALMALAFACAGMTSSWYFTGTGSARGLLVWEAVPRTLACLSAGGLLLAGFPLIAYPIALIAASLFTYLVLARKITGRLSLHLGRGTVAEVSSQFRTTVSRFINGTYMTGGVSIVGLVAPSSLVVFAGYDRLQKSLFNMAVSFPTSLIAWVARSTDGVYRRQRVALAVDAVFCLLLATCCYFILPVAMHVVYAGVIATNRLTDLILCTSLAMMVFAEATVAHGMMPARLDQFAATVMTASYAVGIGLIITGAALWGTNGALLALIATEAVVISLGLTRTVMEGRRKDSERRSEGDLANISSERILGNDF